MKTIETIVLAVVIVAIGVMALKKITCYVLLITGAVIIVTGLRGLLWRNPCPPTAWQSFNSWGEAWELPPRPSGWHMLYLAYHKRDGGRLDTETKRTDIKLTVVDEMDNKVVPLSRNWEYGEIGPYKDFQLEEVGAVWLVEGHRYRIEVNPDQLKELAKYRHRLGIDVDVSEKMNWNDHGGKDIRKAPRATKTWDPVQLQKARGARKAFEAEQARKAGGN